MVVRGSIFFSFPSPSGRTSTIPATSVLCSRPRGYTRRSPFPYLLFLLHRGQEVFFFGEFFFFFFSSRFARFSFHTFAPRFSSNFLFFSSLSSPFFREDGFFFQRWAVFLFFSLGYPNASRPSEQETVFISILEADPAFPFFFSGPFVWSLSPPDVEPVLTLLFFSFFFVSRFAFFHLDDPANLDLPFFSSPFIESR